MIYAIIITAIYTLIGARAFIVLERMTKREGDPDQISSPMLATIWPILVIIVGVGIIIFDEEPLGWEKKK